MTKPVNRIWVTKDAETYWFHVESADGFIGSLNIQSLPEGICRSAFEMFAYRVLAGQDERELFKEGA